MIKDEYCRRYYEKNKDRVLEVTKKYHRTKKGKKALDKARKKERDNLTDNYIRQTIWINVYNTTKEKIIRKDISDEIIEQYRKILTIKRINQNENKKANKKCKK